MSAVSGTRASASFRCPHTCGPRRARTSSRKSVIRLAMQQYDPEVIPPPPPPPGPSPSYPQGPQGTDRRQLLLYVGGLAAVVGTGIWSVAQYQDKTQGSDLERVRLASGFKRERDGHVWLKMKDGQWTEIRLDAKVPGTILFRDPKGKVYSLGINNIQQIDLTDDFIVTALFADGAWQSEMQVLRARDDEGDLVEVVMDQEDFRNLISILA